jgi:hypothetical protein
LWEGLNPSPFGYLPLKREENICEIIFLLNYILTLLELLNIIEIYLNTNYNIMIKLLDREDNHVIVKMDISTYDEISSYWNKYILAEKKEDKKWKFDDLIEEARNSKAYATVDDLFYDLEN